MLHVRVPLALICRRLLWMLGLGACAQKPYGQLASGGRAISIGVLGGGAGGGLSGGMQPAAILAVAAACFVQLCLVPVAASADPLVVSQ